MASNEHKSEDDSSPKFTREYRINELNKIEQNIAKLLQSAGLAIKALTDQPMSNGGDSTSIEQRKEVFTSAASDYFSLLSSVDVNLRRQIYALEEANIIPGESQQTEGGSNIVGGSMGNLDVGRLNSRTDKVGKEKEAELWAKAQEIAESLAENDAEAMELDQATRS